MDQVEDKFAGMIYQTEIERIKFLLKSYLRVRLSKVREGYWGLNRLLFKKKSLID